MLHGPLAGKIFMFALPLALSSMLQQLFNAADLAVVGRFTNPRAMAAVGSNSSMISLLVSLFVGMSVGANVVIGNLMGQGRRDKISDAVHTAVALSLVSGVFLMVTGLIVAQPALRIMGAPEDVIRLATLYLRIYFCGMPMITVYNFASAILRGKGDSRRPFLALVSAGILNILLNLFFVIVCGMSVAGVALATVLSNCLSGGLTLWFLMREEGEFHLDLRRLRIRREHLIGILRIGIPAGVQGMVFSISNVVIQSAINSFGAACIAGMTAAQNIDYISYCLMNAFAQTCVTFTAQNYGACQIRRCRKVWSISMIMGLGLDIVLLALMIIFRGPIVGMFTTDPEVTRFAMIRIRYVITLHFICGSYEITGGALRGMNRSTVPAVISLLGTCLVRLIYVMWIFPLHRTPAMLILVYPITWTITTTAMNAVYLRILGKELQKEKQHTEELSATASVAAHGHAAAGA